MVDITRKIALGERWQPRAGSDSDLSTTAEISCYVSEIVKGIRLLTKSKGRKDLEFLDFVLAVAEREASTLSTRMYN